MLIKVPPCVGLELNVLVLQKKVVVEVVAAIVVTIRW